MNEHSDTGDRRYQPEQELQPFCGQLTADKIDARKVVARPSEASDKTDLDRIFPDKKHDGDGCGRSLCRQRRRTICGNHRHPSPNQLRCELWQSIRLILSPAVHYRDVLSFDEAGIFQAPVECAQAVSERFGRGAVEEANRRNRRLLRARRERPRRRAAEQRDELAALHSITSSAGATAKRCHSPGTPLRACMPRSSNAMPEPTTRSFTVLETSTSPGFAVAATRLPICTAIPSTLLSSTWH